MQGQYGPNVAFGNQPGHVAVNTQAIKGARAGCAEPGDHHVGFDTAGHITFGGYSSYFIAAADENNQAAWRKYDQNRTVLYIEDNTKPNKPTELSVTPWRAPCKHCGGKTYLGDDLITIRARVTDPDGDQMRPYWTVNGGAYYGGVVGSWALATSKLDVRGKPDHTPYTWSVAAVDAHAGPTAAGPSFVIDRQASRKAATVGSDLYPADNRWHGGVGAPGRFTFTPNYEDGEVRDVDHFRYGWDDGAPYKVDATVLGGSASVLLTPPGDGPRDLYVYAVDRAGRLGPVTRHHFYVRAGNGPLAQWSFEGNARDSAFLGDRHGTLEGGTSYTPGFRRDQTEELIAAGDERQTAGRSRQ
ncbi:hypothetical protein OG394_04060 [Kribbella sp. NBC_01245]|uniref:hypothetical protein n=1 Tax=Kribbella sp. NBC_01245 TaxID=2903578 RepID=UPI002E2C99BF|nr:hypothetical protein [Kribbella sp. NBC_01245]